MEVEVDPDALVSQEDASVMMQKRRACSKNSDFVDSPMLYLEVMDRWQITTSSLVSDPVIGESRTRVGRE